MEGDLPSQEILRLTLKEKEKRPIRARLRNEKVSKYIEKVLEYSCDVCGKEFNNKYNLHAHSKIHLTTYAYHCSACPYKSKTQKYLSRHIKKAHNKPTAHKCSVCGKMFHFQSKLKTHMLVHTGEKPYKCDVCGKAFNALYTLTTHKFIHTDEKPYQCSFCDYACRDCSTLRKHQARHMGLERVYQCKICNISCSSKWMLKNHVAERHLEIELKTFTCDQCGKIFKLRSNLTNHIKAVHDKAKMCKCKICGYQLTNKGNLASHMRKHVDVRPYKCTFEGCDKGFKTTSDLNKHAIIHTPSRHHACGACGRRFARAARRDAHVARHRARPRRVACHHCGVAFYNKRYLATHIQRKHTNKKKFMCDLCDFVTHNKPSIVMHLKYGHGNENDRKCRICRTVYKMHKYLKMHYLKTHNIRYKTVQRKKPNEEPIEIKEEPLEELSEESIDLFEVDKQEVLDDLEHKELNEDIEDIKEYSEGVLSEDMARVIINNNRQKLNRVPEQIFDEFFIDQALKQHVERKENNEKICVDLIEENRMKECVNELLNKHQRKVKKREKLERIKNPGIDVNEVRKRSKIKTNGVKRRRNVVSVFTASENVKNGHNIDEEPPYFTETNETVTNERSEELSMSTVDNNVGNKKKLNSATTSRVEVRDVKKRGNLKRISASMSRNDEESINGNSKKEELMKTNSEDVNKSENTGMILNNDREDATTKTSNGGLKFNTYQCYTCFKLFNTKSELTQHCSEHFDICSEKMLKRCPICKYVTKCNLKRHMELHHQMNINLARAKLKDREDNTNGSRYCYEIENGLVLELIPSVSNLNKRAITRLDELNRKAKDNLIGTTKLVRKGSEWVVETKKLDRNNYVLPESIHEVCNIDNYLDKMKFLSRVAKKNGSKMLFPCDNCEKICQTLSALKLHTRKHEANPKPYKPKVWKHKTKDNLAAKETTREKTTKDRLAKPKPIANKHKCDEKLIEFYKNNITGGDIEFWQFLKIYNKMGRENVKDFKDLETRTDFGIHMQEESNNNENVIKNKELGSNKISRDKTRKNKKNVFKRVIMLSKRDYLKRNRAKSKLREKIYNAMHNEPQNISNP